MCYVLFNKYSVPDNFRHTLVPYAAQLSPRLPTHACWETGVARGWMRATSYWDTHLVTVLNKDNHHHHHFICPMIQQYAHLHRYNFRRAGQQGPTKNTNNSCPKTCNKTATGYIFYHTSKILQTKKLEKSIFSMLFLKHLKMAKMMHCE